MNVIKSDGSFEEFDEGKIKRGICEAYVMASEKKNMEDINAVVDEVKEKAYDLITAQELRRIIEDSLVKRNFKAGRQYILYWAKKEATKQFVIDKERFIARYKASYNNADATVDDNSNVNGKNISLINAEIHKTDNILVSRGMITRKLSELYPKFNCRNYVKDLEKHIIYKNDESSFTGAIAPYCCSISMYPFLINGIENVGGLSVAPRNLDSFCGMYCNLLFAVASQFAGAVATSEALVFFDYFARKEFGEDYYKNCNGFYKIGNKFRKLLNGSHYWTNDVEELRGHDFGSEELNKLRDELVYESERPLTDEELKEYSENVMGNPNYTLKLGDGTRTIRGQIHQYFQQIVYTANQPAASRNGQSCFLNFSYFDKPFFNAMFENFYFPDGTRPLWDSINWIQKDFMMWFNEERLRCLLTFPVESFALIYKDGKFVDEENARFVADELERGHSFFIYISDTADSLSSCCFSKEQKVLWKSSTRGVNLTTLEELHNLKWEDDKKNLRIFHNGSWVVGKTIKLPNRNMFRVVTENNKEFLMTDNHINVTIDGEKKTSDLTNNDYLMFNTMELNPINENDEGLTYEQGFTIGAFLGDGSFGKRYKNGIIYDVNFSQNVNKYEICMKMVSDANKQLGGENYCNLSSVYNNVYPLRICSKKLAAFIQKWTNWKEGTCHYNKELNLNCLLQSLDFRKGILDGWYNTDGGNSNRCYTTSKKLVECMEVLVTSLGLQSIITVSDKTDEKVVIRGVEYNRNHPLYCLRWYTKANHRANKDSGHTWIKKNNSIYFKIKTIEEIKDYNDDVYCIECNNENEPYFTLPCGLITHNCRLKNKIQTNEFNFTNGNMGVETGSKSVITLNLSRITQDFCKKEFGKRYNFVDFTEDNIQNYRKYLVKILERVYKYHNAYNELLWDMYEAKLLPVYTAGFIDLNKQYLTIGINGLNQAAEFLGLECHKNEPYSEFCRFIFGTIKDENEKHKTKKTTFNTEQVPAESLAIKNYNWDKEDGYWVPEDTNLYASYIFKPNDDDSVLDKLYMMSKNFATDMLDGGAAAHINLSEHLSSKQYYSLLEYAAKVGCSYWTVNVPNAKCECGFITKHPITKCPKCGSEHIEYYDRVIGYLTKIRNWSEGRRAEQKKRCYLSEDKVGL